LKIITFFNHKGGVAKTTNCYHLGWKLAEKGKRVILVDADSQCNLTGLAMGLMPNDYSSEVEDAEENGEDGKASELLEKIEREESEMVKRADKFWRSVKTNNIHSALRPAFKAEPRPLEPVEVVPVPGNENLLLLPGHIELADYESDLALAQNVKGSIGSQQNIPGAISHLLSITGEKYGADYLLVDVSPSLGAINQNIVSISDEIIIPCAPDYFSMMALMSLKEILPKWKNWALEAARSKGLQQAVYKFPEPKFRVLGLTISRFVMYKGKPASAFAAWIDKIQRACVEELKPAMQEADILSEVTGTEESSFIMAKIRDFNSLRPKSQEAQKPVFALTDEDLGLSGRSLQNMIKQREQADQVFERFADLVIESK